jgi:hypothetical protein
MRTRLVATIVALVGWAFFAPRPWASFASAQTSLVTTTVDITSATGVNPRGAGYYNANVTVNLVAGNVYDMRIAVATTPAYAYDTYCYLLDPARAVVGEDDDNNLGLGNPYGSQIVYTATATGSYTLVCSTVSGGDSYSAVPVTVTVTFTAAPPPPPPPSSAIIPLTYPANDTRAINGVNNLNPRNAYGAVYANVYSITLNAGQQYQILLRYTGSTVIWPGDDNYMYLYGPGMSYITEDDDGGSGYQDDSVYTNYGASLITYTPKVTGTYYIVATTYGVGEWFNTPGVGITMSAAQLTVGPVGPPPPPFISGSGIPNVKLAPPAGGLEMRPMFAFTHLNLEDNIYPVSVSPRIEWPSIAVAVPSKRIV